MRVPHTLAAVMLAAASLTLAAPALSASQGVHLFDARRYGSQQTLLELLQRSRGQSLIELIDRL